MEPKWFFNFRLPFPIIGCIGWFFRHYALPGQREDMWTSKLLCSRNHMIICEQAKTSEWTSSSEFQFLRITRAYFKLRGEEMCVDGSTRSRNAPWLGFMSRGFEMNSVSQRCQFLTHSKSLQQMHLLVFTIPSFTMAVLLERGLVFLHEKK